MKKRRPYIQPPSDAWCFRVEDCPPARQSPATIERSPRLHRRPQEQPPR
jgi:hypothetical protein